MSNPYDHLTHIKSHEELALYELIPNVVWFFDLDKHGWWWGNEAAVKFWGLDNVDQLIHKDLSDDTQGARDRTKQTFDLAAKNGLTIDPWTTYPGGKPKTLMMMHRAVLLGPEKHRGIIAYINEEVNLGETPENLLLGEAMRYTQVMVTSFTLEGSVVVENPAATEAYKSIEKAALEEGENEFIARFEDPKDGHDCLAAAVSEKGGTWTYWMKTDQGRRRHRLDIRQSRHPLNGDFMMLVSEYDVTDLYEALDQAHAAQEQLREMAHYDALTGLPSIHLFQETTRTVIEQAKRHNEKLALMFVDLDGFKAVNDNWGHDAGDRVLQTVAERLKGAIRSSDMAARIGGDEFLLLITKVDHKDSLEGIAQKVINSLSHPITLTEIGIEDKAQIGASIGIALYPDQGQRAKTLLKAADDCMYQVKRAGKNNFQFASLGSPL